MPPINYADYPVNWKTEIRPAILKRANNCCESCKVENYSIVFRGFINRNQPTEKEIYQDIEGRVFDADNSNLLFTDFFASIYPLNGNPESKAIKIVLTIAHLDHCIKNNNYENLRAWCQRCHNRYDSVNRRENRKKKQPDLFDQ